MRLILFFLILFSVQNSISQQTEKEQILNTLDSAMLFFETDLELAKQMTLSEIEKARALNFNKGLGYGFMNLSSLAYYDGNMSLAVEYCNKADTVFRKAGEKGLIASNLSNRGVLYSYLKFYDKAVDDYLVAIDINKSIGNENGLSHNYVNLGGIYLDEDLLDKAMYNYKKALSVDEKLGDSIEIAIDYINIGDVWAAKNQVQKADSLFIKGLSIFESFGIDFGIIESNYHLGNLYLTTGAFQKARDYYTVSYELSKKANKNGTLLKSIVGIANSYKKEENYAKGVNWFEDAITKSKDVQDSLQLRDNYLQASLCYSKLEKNELAFDALEQYTLLNSLINRSEKDQLLKSIELKHQLFDQGKELKLLEQKSTIQEFKIRETNTTLLVSIIGLLLLIVISVILLKWRRERWKREKIQLQQKLFRSQVDPHFIFNVFNSIQSCLINKDYKEGRVYLKKFAQLMRAFLMRVNEQYATIEEETNLIQLYLEIESFRLEDKMSFEISVDPEIDIYSQKIPTFIAQTYLENAVWHGLASLKTGGIIRVNISQKEQGSIYMTIEDNGIGINQSKKDKQLNSSNHTSRGMRITSERIQNLNHKTRTRFSVNITDLSDVSKDKTGTLVKLQLPIIK